MFLVEGMTSSAAIKANDRIMLDLVSRVCAARLCHTALLNVCVPRIQPRFPECAEPSCVIIFMFLVGLGSCLTDDLHFRVPALVHPLLPLSIRNDTPLCADLGKRSGEPFL
jgi:hypothetical protein